MLMSTLNEKWLDAYSKRCTSGTLNSVPVRYLHFQHIVYSAGMKVELHIWNNDKVKCHVFYQKFFWKNFHYKWKKSVELLINS